MIKMASEKSRYKELNLDRDAVFSLTRITNHLYGVFYAISKSEEGFWKEKADALMPVINALNGILFETWSMTLNAHGSFSAENVKKFKDILKLEEIK